MPKTANHVFASTKMRCKPYGMSRMMQYHIKPVAAKTGSQIKGWHTSRHYSGAGLVNTPTCGAR